ncbi:hypothetical protein chiPu_0011101 [Chiloscyllium punctatum]|uniref:Uncharacterized protein n=1 Tax=Chiloscyllium punctatum TaxID=137246 RepID=A0A401SQI1_CHIPU|nr:hypothetical protein [Chiloscyllium punctatum]
MGKEQELLDAARIGNVAVVEKLLSGKKGLLGSGSSSIPLSSLLRMYKGLVVKLWEDPSLEDPPRDHSLSEMVNVP